MTDFPTVAVLGYGTMGAGIAQLIAESGRRVVVLDIDEDSLERGRAHVADFLQSGVTRGKITAERRDEVLGRIESSTDMIAIVGADLVIEAVSEQREVKADLLGRVAALVRDDAVLVTNTSALSVTDLATTVTGPERFAGLHFFNPAPLMRIVEVVRAVQTDAAVVERLAGFVRSLGSAPIVVKDRPGFLVNNLLIPYLNDVVQAFDDDLATAEDLDTAMRLGLGYKLGPLELLDMIGLDVHEHASRSAYEATHDPRYAPPPLLTQMVAAGRLGAKSGRGFRNEETVR